MRNEEYHIQVAVAQYLRTQYPQALWTTSPGGMKLPVGLAMKQKRMGYLPGVFDLLIFEPRMYCGKHYCGLFVELKTKTGVVSHAQEEFYRKAVDRGYFTFIAYGFDDAVYMLDAYLCKTSAEVKT